MALVLLGATLAGCRPATAGRRCATTEAGHDATNVLVCRDGRWERLMTVGQAADLLAHPYGIRAAVDAAEIRADGSIWLRGWVHDVDRFRMVVLITVVDGEILGATSLDWVAGGRPDVVAQLGGRAWLLDGPVGRVLTRGVHRVCLRAVPYSVAYGDESQPSGSPPFGLLPAAQASPDLVCTQRTLDRDLLARAAIDQVTWSDDSLRVVGWIRRGGSTSPADWRLADQGGVTLGFCCGATFAPMERPDVDAAFGPGTQGFVYTVALSEIAPASPPFGLICLTERFPLVPGAATSACRRTDGPSGPP